MGVLQYRDSETRGPEVQKLEVPKSRSVENESFKNTKIAELNEKLRKLIWNPKCLLFLLVLVINVEDCS
jgi:hypothetical protein